MSSCLKTSLPYAVAVIYAVTFCSLSFVPATSNTTFLVLLSKLIFKALTWIVGLFVQVVKPLVESTSPASTPTGRAASKRAGRVIREAREHRMAAVCDMSGRWGQSRSIGEYERDVST